MPTAFGLVPAPATAGARSENRHRRALRRPVALIASIAAAAVGLGACGAGRDGLGTDAGPCFAALPVANQAVAGRGSLAGVRLADVSHFTARHERAMHELLDQLPVRPAHDVCLVAYAGSFTLGQVGRPLGPPPSGGVGRYAIVVVTTTTKPELLATFVVRREPLGFARVHVGL